MPENLTPVIWGESWRRDRRILEPAAYCLIHKLDDLQTQGARPWAPGGREELVEVEHGAVRPADVRCLSEVAIFVDLSAAEMDAIAAAAPMKTYPAGSLIFSPNEPMETLFILKAGRVRVFRVALDGRALTTAILSPGTIFGEMLLLGRQMHDNFAEALDEVTVCVMSRSDVQRFLLADARIALRISEILGPRVSQLERRLADTVFKSVPQRVASTLCVLAEEQPRRWRGRLVPIALTHEQIAALSGTSRETATKVLGEFAERGLLRLGRGKMTILDLDGLANAAAKQAISNAPLRSLSATPAIGACGCPTHGRARGQPALRSQLFTPPTTGVAARPGAGSLSSTCGYRRVPATVFAPLARLACGSEHQRAPLDGT